MSKSIQQYNALNGTVANRQTIERIIAIANKEEQYHIAEKLQNVLDNSSKEKFEIEIRNKSFEIVPASLAGAFELDPHNEPEDLGLAKGVSPDDIYQKITDRMLDLIKKASGKDYVKKWKSNVYGSGYLIPFNFDTKKRYRGANFFLLTSDEPLENPFFMTFKQIEAHKGKLKKGSKGSMVVYFTKLYKVTDKEKNIDFGTYDKKKAIDFARANGIAEDKIGYLPILKYYNVFNGKDIEGIDFDLENFKIGYIEKKLPPKEKMQLAEAIVENYPAPQPKIKHGGDKASYNSGSDLVKMPYMADFETAQDYYRTLFHELAHSTGSSNRLNRTFGKRFGDKNYAFEELVAEWGATFLSAEAGIIWHTNNNHAEYLKNWNGALTHIKDDNRFIMRACTKAQELTDFVLNLDENGEPKYRNDIDLNAKPEKEEKLPKKPKSKKRPGEKKETPKAPVKTAKKTVSKKQQDKKPVAKKLKIKEPEKVDENGQYGLFKPKKPMAKKPNIKELEKMAKQYGLFKPEKKGLNAPAETEPVAPKPQNAKIQNIASAGNNQESEFYTVAGEVGKFLQAVERKPFESVVITMDGMQGAGKTTTLYKFMDAFASAGNRSLFLSLEEHPASALAKEKVAKYLSPEAVKYTDSVGEVENVAELYDFIKDYEVIFIDSWQKLQRMVGSIRLDEDLRKKFNGKVFVIIFQQTTDGRTKGGAEVVFDGDIIIKMVKTASFAENYAYFDKNRYTKIPIENIRYNIASETTYNPNETSAETDELEEPEATAEPAELEPINFSFEIN
jgi:antirestriction protein ArdC/KaiC/GvpD/RAD55 family RecA-like ATPase